MDIRLVTQRLIANKTQTEIAEAAGIHQETLSRIERGTHHPRRRTALAIAAALGVDVEHLWPEYATRPSPDSSSASEADSGGLDARR